MDEVSTILGGARSGGAKRKRGGVHVGLRVLTPATAGGMGCSTGYAESTA